MTGKLGSKLLAKSLQSQTASETLRRIGRLNSVQKSKFPDNSSEYDDLRGIEVRGLMNPFQNKYEVYKKQSYLLTFLLRETTKTKGH